MSDAEYLAVEGALAAGEYDFMLVAEGGDEAGAVYVGGDVDGGYGVGGDGFVGE